MVHNQVLYVCSHGASSMLAVGLSWNRERIHTGMSSVTEMAVCLVVLTVAYEAGTELSRDSVNGICLVQATAW